MICSRVIGQRIDRGREGQEEEEEGEWKREVRREREEGERKEQGGKYTWINKDAPAIWSSPDVTCLGTIRKCYIPQRRVAHVFSWTEQPPIFCPQTLDQQPLPSCFGNFERIDFEEELQLLGCQDGNISTLNPALYGPGGNIPAPEIIEGFAGQRTQTVTLMTITMWLHALPALLALTSAVFQILLPGAS